MSEVSLSHQAHARGTFTDNASATVGVERKNTNFEGFLGKEKMGTWEGEDRKGGRRGGCWGR